MVSSLMRSFWLLFPNLDYVLRAMRLRFDEWTWDDIVDPLSQDPYFRAYLSTARYDEDTTYRMNEACIILLIKLLDVPSAVEFLQNCVITDEDRALFIKLMSDIEGPLDVINKSTQTVEAKLIGLTNIRWNLALEFGCLLSNPVKLSVLYKMFHVRIR